MSEDLPQWIIDGLTDIKMAACDKGMSDQEFFFLISSFLDDITPPE